MYQLNFVKDSFGIKPHDPIAQSILDWIYRIAKGTTELENKVGRSS